MKRFLRALIVMLVVAAVATFAYLKLFPRQVVAAANAGPTATVTRGTLTATVNAAGNIAAQEQVDLNFGQSGTVKKVDAHVGDQVKAGQVLAELDTTDLELQVRNAEVNLKLAQDKLAQAKNPNSAQDIANSRAQLQAAQANYTKATAGASRADVAAAQAAVSSAEAAYTAAVASAGTGNSQLEAAAAAVEKAQSALQSAQAAYDRVASAPNIGMLPQSSALQSATIDYQQAVANYQSLQATTGTDAASKVQAAAAQLKQAQDNLAKLQNQVTPADVQAAQAQVTQAQNNLDKLLAGSDANTLDIAQNGVEQAQIALQQAQLQMQKAQITAPFDGVITQVNIAPGQASQSSGTAGSGVAIQEADLSHLQIVVNLAEVDVNRIKNGQQAQITLDALPDAALQGAVSQIAPAGVQQQGVVNYPVTISLNNPPATVKTGMTANVNIVVDERDNVLMVPNRAIRTQGRQKVATVLFEGQQIQVPVQTGLSNDTSTEVTSGLREGDVVLLTTTSTQAGNGGGFRVGGPPVGGFGR